jgi:hypothetical protein
MKKNFALVTFFLKTVYFSPVNNPLYVIVIAIGIILLAGDSLGKHEVSLLMYVIGCTHAFLPNATSISCMVLPITSREYAVNTAAASMVYGIFWIALLTALLNHVERLPVFIGPLQHITREGQFGDTLHEIAGTIILKEGGGRGWRNKPGYVTIPLTESMLFNWLPGAPKPAIPNAQPGNTGSLDDFYGVADQESVQAQAAENHSGTSVDGSALIIALAILLFFTMDTIRSTSQHLHVRGLSTMILDSLLIAMHICLGVAIAADIILPIAGIHRIHGYVQSNPLLVQVFVITALMLTLCRIGAYGNDIRKTG